jgi:hypothetical protein
MIHRRSFLGGLGGAFAVRPASAAEQSVSNTSFEPARHAEDDWMGQIGGKHRMLFDTTTPDGFGHALLFASNFIDTNKNAYGLDYPDIGVLIVARHNSTSFAYNDMMWEKYGKAFSQRASFTDPKTKEAPTANLFNASGYGATLPSNGMTLDSLIKRGAHFGVCRLATRLLAGAAATTTGSDAGKINEELIANIVPNAHMVPAGIVAVNRAQERGFTFAVGI